MSSVLYKKRETATENGRLSLFFFAFVTDKDKSASHRAPHAEAPCEKTATLPYEKMPSGAKKVLTYKGKYGMILSEKFESPKVF